MMQRSHRFSLVSAVMMMAGTICLDSCTVASPVPAHVQLPQQATAMSMNGVKNLHQVSPQLYRSGQPSPAAFAELERMGLRSVLNLREYHVDTDEADHTGLHLVGYPMAAGSVTERDVENCLRIIRLSPKPLLVHCWHGSDRTGIIVAAYRIVFQGWTAEQAEKEMRIDTYGYSDRIYRNLVELLRTTDWQAMRQRLEQYPEVL